MTNSFKVNVTLCFFFGAGWVSVISILLACEYMDCLVHIIVVHQSIAMYIGCEMLQDVQGNHVACFELLQPHELLHQIKLEIQN